ncbi:MAG: hypothetical protein ACRDNI_11480 [Gaiellaceae bacterium]
MLRGRASPRAEDTLPPAVGLAVHLANGAVFGAAFRRLGGCGWAQGVLAAQAENLALWPAMTAVDRLHPDRRSGAWPPLASNGRVFAYECAAHALFGAVLGLGVGARTRRQSLRSTSSS